MAWSDNRFD
eukprot:g1395.t1